MPGESAIIDTGGGCIDGNQARPPEDAARPPNLQAEPGFEERLTMRVKCKAAG